MNMPLIAAYISERDIDLLLLEELYVSADFRSWLVERVFGSSARIAEFMGAWHSVDHYNLGETDLLFQFKDGAGDVIVVLMEDKIGALPQPEQAMRYRLRGEEGNKDKSWNQFKTCIIAPEAYMNLMAEEAQQYDIRIIYESIRDWFIQSNPRDKRMMYKASLIQEGIDQNRRGYQQVPDAVVTQFWADYWQFACLYYPELRMEKPGQKAARSDWAQFKTSSKLWIRHKLEKGTVELEIPSACDKLEQIAALNYHLLAEDLTVIPCGKSASFTISTPDVDKLSNFTQQAEAVRAGLAAVARLMSISSKIELNF
jgi:hypothetical protein